jgi:hypothetical protein
MMPAESYIAERIELILARPEFHSYIPEFMGRVLNWIVEQLGRLIDSLAGFTNIPKAVIITVLIALLLIGIFFMLRARRMKRLKQHKTQVFSDWINTDAWSKSLAYAKREEYDYALIWLFLAYLKILADLGLIEPHQSKTNFQYEMELLQNRYQCFTEFKSFKNVFNAVRYGGRSADQGTYDYWRGYLEGIV